MAGTYNIKAIQGDEFSLFLEYQESNGNGFTLDLYSAQMQVRRSVIDPGYLLWISGSTLTESVKHTRAVTGGGSTGEWTGNTGGVLGTGGIQLDVSSAGASGTTGGILVTVGAATMVNVPIGRHHYDLEINSGSSAHTIVRGAFEVEGKVTR